jgi:hypothetical protein
MREWLASLRGQREDAAVAAGGSGADGQGIPPETDGEPVPAALFGARFYRESHPEVAASGEDPWEHFVRVGRSAGLAPSKGAKLLRKAIRARAEVSRTPMADLVGLAPPSEHHQIRTGRLYERLRWCAHPRLYAAQLGPEEALGPDPDLDEVVTHFLAHGAHDGLRVSALFHPAYYAEQLREHGLEVEPGVDPFFHWLTTGWSRQIVPTPLFDPDVYEEQQPQAAQREPWSFVHYLRTGCYKSGVVPSPVGKHHSRKHDAGFRQRQEPLLLEEMLYRADDHDLRSTSWLEEGCRAALRSYASLESPRMRELVARAAALEPQVFQPAMHRPIAGCPPRRGRRAFLDHRAEDLRRDVDRDLGLVQVDAVVVVARPDRPLPTALLTALRQEGSVLLVAADAAYDGSGTASASPAPEGVTTLELDPYAAGLDDEARLHLLLDLVRGLAARRVVVAGSPTGQRLVTQYGRQLSTRASLGFDLSGSSGDGGLPDREFQAAFPVLDWVIVDPDVRADLVERYVMAEPHTRRVVAAGDTAADEALRLPGRRRG